MVQRDIPSQAPLPQRLPFAAFTDVVSDKGTTTMLVELDDERIRMKGGPFARGTELDQLDAIASTDRGTELTVRGHALALEGMGAVAFHALLSQLRPDLHAPLWAPSEAQVLGSAPATWQEGSARHAGSLVLTTDELIFQSWPPRPDGPRFRAPRHELADHQLCGHYDKLEIRRPGGASVTFTGPGALLAHLSLTGPPVPLLAVPAARASGLRSAPGLLVLGKTELVHVPTGTLDWVSGRSPVRIPLAEVAEIVHGSAPSPTLRIHAEGTELQLRFPEASLVADQLRRRLDDDLARAVLSLEAVQVADDAEDDAEEAAADAEVAATIAAARAGSAPASGGDTQTTPPAEPGALGEGEGDGPATRVAGPDRSPVLNVSGARLNVEPGRWRYGTIVLRQHEVRFQPRAGATSGRIRIPVSVVTRSRTGSHALLLRARNRDLRFHVGDPGFVDRYWAEARTPDRIYHPSGADARILRHLSGLQRTVRFWVGDDLYLAVDSPRIRLAEHGVAFRLPGHFHKAPEPGTEVRVEIFHQDGIFEYASPVESRLVSTPDPSRGERGAYHVMVLRIPKAVRRFDKRQDRRMVVRVPVRMERSEEETTARMRRLVLGLTLDLSPSGVAVRCASALKLGERLALTIQLDTDELICSDATVVRRDDDRELWGLRFIDMDGRTLTTLLRLARDREREQLARDRTGQSRRV